MKRLHYHEDECPICGAEITREYGSDAYMDDGACDEHARCSYCGEPFDAMETQENESEGRVTSMGLCPGCQREEIRERMEAQMLAILNDKPCANS